MLRSFLSLLLATTHLLTCGAAPLYLCIDADGSMCIDAGPADCDCCGDAVATAHDHEACGATCDEHEREAAVADAACREAGPDSLVSATPCDCEHLAISGSCAPAIVRASSAEACKFMPIAMAHPSLTTVPTATLGPSADLFEQPSSTLFLSMVLRSVVLRC
jgi:hypothetical protein